MRSPGDPSTREVFWRWAKAEGIWAFVLPLFLFYGTRGRLGAGGALILASLSPLAALAVGLLRERTVRPAALIVACSALLGAMMAWAFADARAIVYKDTVVDALWGIAFGVLSRMPSQPLHRLLAPATPLLLAGAGTPEWNAPQVRATLQRLLLLWSAQSFVFALSKVLCLWWFGLEGYLPTTILFRVSLQTPVTVYSLWRLRRALKDVRDADTARGRSVDAAKEVA